MAVRARRPLITGVTVTAAEAVVAAMADWADLWDRRDNHYCPNCQRAGQVLIRAADGTVVCPECK